MAKVTTTGKTHVISPKLPSSLKILFYDIETTPNQGWTWGKYQQNLLAFTKRRELLSFAYSYGNTKAIKCVTREGEATDEQLVRKLYKVLATADVVVAHNGDSFDNKIANARFTFYDLPPLKMLTTIDTKKAAYSFFMFDSNSLDDLAQYFKIGKKMPTPGFSLWEGCMANRRDSWRTMVRYNKHDVVLLKAVYEKLAPRIHNHPNMGRLVDPFRKQLRCPRCSATTLRKEGFRVTHSRTYQRWLCRFDGCGYNFCTGLNEQGKIK